MGFMDKFKKRATDYTEENPDQVDQGIERGGDFVDDRTGGQHSEHVDRGQDMARDHIGAEDDPQGDRGGRQGEQGGGSDDQRGDR